MNRLITSKHQHRLGEGILWDHHSELLLFVDILSKKLFRMDIDSFKIVDEYYFNEYIGWVQITNQPGYYIIGLKSGIATFNVESSEIKFINKEVPQYPYQRLNDSFVDIRGRLWYGSMEYESVKFYDGVLANFSLGDEIFISDVGYGITNGPIIDNENKYLFHNDSKKGIVYRFNYDIEEGELKGKKIFLQFDSQNITPDGMCIDDKNNLFIAIWGGKSVNEYEQSGELIHSYKLPEKFITNVCFGGKNLDRMFVTTAKSDGFDISKKIGGHIYEVLDHNRRGFKSNEFII